MNGQLQALLGFASTPPAAFDPASRYSGLALATLQTAAGPVAYVTRRFIPSVVPAAAVVEHTVTQGERLDTIAARYFGDPTQFWRVCDANDALRPEDLTATPGFVLRVPSVPGIAGAPFV